jgi:hypothetical protein
MKMTRRTALLGAAITYPAALTLPLPMFPPQVSPFLPAQWGPVGHILQYRKPDALQSFNVEIKKVTAGFTVANIDDAENAYLVGSHIADEVWDERAWRDRNTTWTNGVWHRPFTKGIWMACALRRQAALVAARGRRGYANIALMHPNMIEQIGRENLVDPAHFEGAGTIIGRWTRTAELPKWENVGSTIYCSPHLSPDEAYVLYVQHPVDAGGILLNDDGHDALIMQEVSMMTGPQQYASRVRFSERKTDSG